MKAYLKKKMVSLLFCLILLASKILFGPFSLKIKHFSSKFYCICILVLQFKRGKCLVNFRELGNGKCFHTTLKIILFARKNIFLFLAKKYTFSSHFSSLIYEHQHLPVFNKNNFVHY